jgi:hypothetical protein
MTVLAFLLARVSESRVDRWRVWEIPNRVINRHVKEGVR